MIIRVEQYCPFEIAAMRATIWRGMSWLICLIALPLLSMIDTPSLRSSRSPSRSPLPLPLPFHYNRVSLPCPAIEIVSDDQDLRSFHRSTKM